MSRNGRPTAFSKRVAAEICARLAEGRSLRDVCRDPDMPGRSTVFRWLGARADFAVDYARAREAAVDALAEDILDIADNGNADWIVKERKDGTPYAVANSEHIQRSRLRVDTRKWLMARLRPTTYGERAAKETDQPVTVQVVRLCDEDDPAAG